MQQSQCRNVFWGDFGIPPQNAMLIYIFILALTAAGKREDIQTAWGDIQTKREDIQPQREDIGSSKLS